MTAYQQSGKEGVESLLKSSNPAEVKQLALGIAEAVTTKLFPSFIIAVEAAGKPELVAECYDAHQPSKDLTKELLARVSK